MWRDPGCGCCLEWAKRIEAAFPRRAAGRPTADMAGGEAQRTACRRTLQSCHTALIQGVVVEGHVPPADIQRLIAARRRPFSGLAVPGCRSARRAWTSATMTASATRCSRFGAAGRRRAVFATHG